MLFLYQIWTPETKKPRVVFVLKIKPGLNYALCTVIEVSQSLKSYTEINFKVMFKMDENKLTNFKPR